MSSTPLLFRVARFMQTHNIRGGFRLAETLRRNGVLDRVVQFELGNGVQVGVPLWLRSYDEQIVRTYEENLVATVSTAAEELPGAIALIDCGADIGLMSGKFVAVCERIKYVRAYEPNSAAYPFLKSNLERLGIPAIAVPEAVSNFDGRGKLEQPAWDSTELGAFLVLDNSGPISVSRIDSGFIPADHSVLLKIDVEGAELNVLRGAVDTLKRAPEFVIAFEAHPLQSRRVDIDPVQILEFINSIRPCTALVAERPQHRIDMSRSLWQQLPAKVHNIVVSTRNVFMCNAPRHSGAF